MDEKKIAGASYVYGFYQEVMNLNHYKAVYDNLIVYIENKYPSKEDFSKADESEKMTLSNTLQMVRYSVNKTYVMLNSINLSLNMAIDRRIHELYNKIKMQFDINRNDLEFYTIGLNSYLVKDVIRSLLESSHEIINTMFSNAPNAPEPEQRQQQPPDFTL